MKAGLEWQVSENLDSMITVLQVFASTVVNGLILLLTTFLWNYICSPLKSFPGPVTSSFTNLWRLYDVLKGRSAKAHIELHRKHGPAVRVGPNALSVSDPRAIRKVYGCSPTWRKSKGYGVAAVKINGSIKSNLFSHRDEGWHSKYLHPIRKLYSMTDIEAMEPHIDDTICLFIEKLRKRFVNCRLTCEMSEYINFFSWDAMGNVNFSHDFGLLEAGRDCEGWLQNASKSIDYFALISQLPLLDRILAKNPLKPIGSAGFLWASNFCAEQLKIRKSNLEYQTDTPPSEEPKKPKDFLDIFLELKEKNEIVDNEAIMMYLMGNVVAGSDTSASLMRSAVYHVLKTPSVHDELCNELRAAKLSGLAQWNDIRGLKFLDAVMRESARIAPSIGLMIERVAPDGGLWLPDNRFIPEGTVVGMNPWVVNRTESIFGSCPDSFDPNRWLQGADETKENYHARLQKMKGTDLTFGHGPRACLGRYLAQMESSKLIATLFNTFDMKLPSEDHEWYTTNSWFVRQSNIPVTLKEHRHG